MKKKKAQKHAERNKRNPPSVNDRSFEYEILPDEAKKFFLIQNC